VETNSGRRANWFRAKRRRSILCSMRLNSDERELLPLKTKSNTNLPKSRSNSLSNKSKPSVVLYERLRASVAFGSDLRSWWVKIRDLDTCETALQASLTSHLVLSTLPRVSLCSTRLMDVIRTGAVIFLSAIPIDYGPTLNPAVSTEPTKNKPPPAWTLRHWNEEFNPLLIRAAWMCPDQTLRSYSCFKPGSSPENL